MKRFEAIVKKSHLDLTLMSVRCGGKEVGIYINGTWQPKPADIKKGDMVEVRKEDNVNGLEIIYERLN